MATEESCEALVLAAGSGRRFGGPKLLAPWRDGVLLDGALSAAFAAPARRVILVTGAGASEVARAGEACADRIGAADRLSATHAVDHLQGLSASLKAGVASVSSDAAGVFVFLGDMPLVPPGMAARLVEALAPGQLAAAPVTGGRRGHPVLLTRPLFAPVMALTGDQGAGVLLKTLGDRLALVETDDAGVLRDVDRPDDLDFLAGST
ncbi:MAG: nucleotidyltransferase family protein [Caulobacter sp.]|nr:nucleotidyltransferase family protein [Caulobacter sp.]